MKTLKLRNILAPFEFNSNFENSLKMALSLAKKSTAKITLLNVIGNTDTYLGDYIVSCTVPFSSSDSLIEEKKQQILNYLHESGISIENIEITIDTGTFNEAIINVNKIKSYDLIVVPDFKKNPIDRFFSEITPLEIMNQTNTAVISVNKYSNKFTIEKIILPIRNVKNWYDKIPFTSSIAKMTGAKVFIIGVSDKFKKNITKQLDEKIQFCKEHFNKTGIQYECEKIIGGGSVFKDIILMSHNKKADLIAVSPPVDYSKLKNYFHSSLYTKLITNGDIPVMGVTLT